MTKTQMLQNLLKALILAIHAFFDLINSSQKNEQALREIQENHETRVGRIVMDITTPKTVGTITLED